MSQFISLLFVTFATISPLHCITAAPSRGPNYEVGSIFYNPDLKVVLFEAKLDPEKEFEWFFYSGEPFQDPRKVDDVHKLDVVDVKPYILGDDLQRIIFRSITYEFGRSFDKLKNPVVVSNGYFYREGTVITMFPHDNCQQVYKLFMGEPFHYQHLKSYRDIPREKLENAKPVSFDFTKHQKASLDQANSSCKSVWDGM